MKFALDQMTQLRSKNVCVNVWYHSLP